MELLEDIDFELAKQIYEERFEIYYGYLLDLNKNNPSKIAEVLISI